MATNIGGNLLHLLQNGQTWNGKDTERRQRRYKTQPLGTPYKQHQ